MYGSDSQALHAKLPARLPRAQCPPSQNMCGIHSVVTPKPQDEGLTVSGSGFILEFLSNTAPSYRLVPAALCQHGRVVRDVASGLSCW
jgi:hypothetical protein